MARYIKLINYVLNTISGRYDIDDELLKIKLIKYISYYISGAKPKDDYIVSLADSIFYDLLNHSVGKKVNKKIKVVGLGGISGNFLIYILAKAYFFDSIEIYENKEEKIELSNAIRYLVFNPYGEISKIDFFVKLCSIFDRVDIKFFENRYIPSAVDEYIIFGAPDLQTRQKIVSLGLKYIFLLHHNEEFYLFTNLSKRYNKYVVSGVPIQENYGRIKLSSFFDNLVRNINIVMEVIESAS